MIAFGSSTFSSWVNGRKYIGRIFWCGSEYFASFTIPTISNAPAYFWSKIPKCFPMGSSFGKNFFTNVSLTTATSCEVAVSVSLKPRPRTIGCPMVRKNCGFTLSQEEPLFSDGAGSGRPSTRILSPQLLPSRVLYNARPTLFHARHGSKTLFKLLVQRRQFRRGIAGPQQVEVHHVAIISLQSEILVLQVAQAFA